jgi:uncharacterized protein (TIGR01777 family)
MTDRVIVTGGTGFIGRELCALLSAAGFEVIVLSRRPGIVSRRLGDGVTGVNWDGKSAGGWADYADGAYGIVNLAGAGIATGRWNETVKDRILRSRLDAGRAVCEAVENAAVKPRVVVQASAIGFYGNRGEEELTESSPHGDGFLADVTRQWEHSTEWVRSFGVRHVVIRTGLVLGSGGGVLPRLLTPFKLFIGGPLGNGRQWMSWIHLRDEAAAIRFLVEREELDGAFNITAPDPVRNASFSGALGRAAGRPSWIRTPSLALRALMGEMANELILTSLRVIPARLLSAGFQFSYPDLEPALRDIFGKNGQ